MDLYSKIISEYPELEIKEGYDPFRNGTISLKDDGDGVQHIVTGKQIGRAHV